MLEIKNIKKSYKIGNKKQNVLNDISIKFRQNEFVTILGSSGSGKTTLLNIIGGIDRYDSGDIIINNKSTKKFLDKDWDAYRNNSIGFVFQNYNLINHISVLDNVLISLKLNNENKKLRKKKAILVLKKVGLENHIYKKPNQLSGGQMQRVAIARSLVNDPDIILADEPTGALDSKTSIQIMDLIKEISKDKLVIMVSHNKELSSKYSTRIIELSDGEIINDSNPYNDIDIKNNYKLKRTKMSFIEALMLSFNNIKTKLGRTFITAFASSIGIIGIALILSLSNGFDIQIDKYEKEILSSMPIVISNQTYNLDDETISKLKEEENDNYTNKNIIYRKKDSDNIMYRKNNITSNYIEYLENIDKTLSYGISYQRNTNINILKKDNNNITILDNSVLSLSSLPKSFSDDSFIDVYYDVLYGNITNNINDLILVVDSSNNVDEEILNAFNIEEDNLKFEDLIGKSIRVVNNNDLYIKSSNIYKYKDNLDSVYKKGYDLKISAIIRMKDDYPSYITGSSIIYTEEFIEKYINDNKDSNIVKDQNKVNYNILTGVDFTNSLDNNMDKNSMLSYLGNDNVPTQIMLYPKDFDKKDKIIDYLDKYNESKSEEDKIVYTDNAKLISSMSSSIMSAITIVLISFSSISLIVSSIMIGIITYISVLERTKEIGILRALGARGKDITRVFNAETFIIGLISGIIGIIITLILIVPVNKLIYNLTDLKNVAVLNPIHAIVLIIISLILTLIGGYIPSKVASKKDPVVALRTE